MARTCSINLSSAFVQLMIGVHRGAGGRCGAGGQEYCCGSAFYEIHYECLKRHAGACTADPAGRVEAGTRGGSLQYVLEDIALHVKAPVSTLACPHDDLLSGRSQNPISSLSLQMFHSWGRATCQ
ncbi:jg2977 [Pararge aegeria aegeria]|uniref:Jg2977 protein n=1 Tax=Pararge aegeria aegeria TaxID=348720 RepID=A0A8S4QMD3_9NEOP|nr:jg2977 [Pararge aegeria aegeria]